MIGVKLSNRHSGSGKATTMSREKAIGRIIETEFPSVPISEVRLLSDEIKKGLSWEAAVQELADIDAEVNPEDQSSTGPEQQAILMEAVERLRDLEKLTDALFKKAVRAAENQRLLRKDEELFHSADVAADF